MCEAPGKAEKGSGAIGGIGAFSPGQGDLGGLEGGKSGHRLQVSVLLTHSSKMLRANTRVALLGVIPPALRCDLTYLHKRCMKQVTLLSSSNRWRN